MKIQNAKKMEDDCIHNLDLIYDNDYDDEDNDDDEEDNTSKNVHLIRCLHKHTTKNMSDYYVINLLDDDGDNIVENEYDDEIICYDNIYYKTNITKLDREICQQYIKHNEKLGRQIGGDIEKFYRCKYCLQLLFCNCGSCRYNSINWESI